MGGSVPSLVNTDTSTVMNSQFQVTKVELYSLKAAVVTTVAVAVAVAVAA